MKREIRERIQKVITLYGYQEMQDGIFEFSPWIAEILPSIYDKEHMPVRISQKGRMAELIGDKTPEAEAEIIALTIESLQKAGIKDFSVELGHVKFLEELIKEAQLPQAEEVLLRSYLEDEDFVKIDQLLNQANVKITTKAAFQVLARLSGNVGVLKEAKQISLNANILASAKHLESVYECLLAYGVESYVSFKLSMNRKREYYTGTIFRVCMNDTKEIVASGGRYDRVLDVFGKQLSVVGCSFDLYNILQSLKQEHKVVEQQATIILYDYERRAEAVTLAKEFREKGKPTEVLKRVTKMSMESYMDSASKKSCANILYLKSNDEIEMINLLTGKRKVLMTKIK